MNDEATFDYADLENVRKVFSVVYTQLVIQSTQINIPDEAFEWLGELEDKLLQVIREKACH